VFSTGWQVDEAKYKQILGVGTEELEVLAKFSREQRFYLKTLVNMGAPGPYPSNDVERLAATTYGVKFNEKMLPKTVLYPLQEAGYIALTRETTGRGAKPFLVAPTKKLIAELIEPLLAQLEKQAGADMRAFLRKPLGEVVAELTAKDKRVRGLALEALAFKLMRLIDLDYVATRLRGVATGGAEVDVIFESSRLVFSRWQIQCKNTSRISLDDVAKEVGLAQFLKSKVIVIASTGKIGLEALKYAEAVRSKLPVNVCYIGAHDLRTISESPTRLVDLISRQAPLALSRKGSFSYLMEKPEYDRPVAVTMEA
jgi:site-specific DNA-methyltransferase (cytosine-N4-specific)